MRLVTSLNLDVIFPVLHGPYGEDGTIQGLLELANVPYVGAGVLASAVGMDKGMMKVVFASHGLPVCGYTVVRRSDWLAIARHPSTTIERELGYPVFVKPANLGSSVGISKAKDARLASPTRWIWPAVSIAASSSKRRCPRRAKSNAACWATMTRSRRCAGEIIPAREFYDYEAKYIDEGSQTVIPADLPPDLAERIRRLSIAAFRAIDGAGMARVDFLLSRRDGSLFVNEVNTIPGFTTISMYSKMWAASGVPYTELVDRLVALAIERHAAKQQLRTSMT